MNAKQWYQREYMGGATVKEKKTRLEMFGSLLKSTVPVGLLLRLDLNHKNGTISTSKPCLLSFQLQSLSTTTEATATRRRRSLHCLSASTEPPPTTTEIAKRTTSSSSKSPQISSVDYLVKSLDLPPESALTIIQHKHIKLKSTANADSVISLLRDFGFSTSDLIGVFSKLPHLFLLDAHKILKPKLEYYTGSGISGEDLVRIITANPHLLKCSLDRVIIPCISFLKSFWGGDIRRVVYQFSLKRGTWILRHFSQSLPHNAQTLRDYGVPDSHILKAMNYACLTIAVEEEEFSDAAREAKEMGFDVSSMMFVYAVSTLIIMEKEKLEARFELLKSFGWTDEQVQSLFMKQPYFFTASDKKLKKALEFFVNKFEWTAYDIIKYPAILRYSFANRILPRSYVLEILISRGLVTKTCLGGAFQASEDVFLKRFVRRYESYIPELLDIYRKGFRMAGEDSE